jgi:CO/xanthine dehydrogenase FAD-binding subunit
MKYHRPEQLDEAKKLLANAQPILIHPRMSAELYADVDAVVDLSRLSLNYIKREGDAIRIGVMTVLQDVADSPLLRTLARGILPEAASLTAHLGLRNVSTIGGVMMNPQSAVDMMLALLALGVGTGHVASLQEISFSCSPQARAALERVARTPHDAPIVAACALTDQSVTRVAIGGVGISPMLVDPAKAQESIAPVADFRASVEYQREMVGVLVKRAMKRTGRILP